MGKKNNDFQGIGDLLAKKKKLEKEIKRIAVPCSHLNKKGELKVELSDGVAKCKKCGLRFGLDQYSSDTVRESVRVVHDVLNQLKVFSDSPDDDNDLIRSLGELDFNLSSIEELYSRMLEEQGRGKKKKKNNDYDAFGSIGRDVSFIGNPKGNRNRW